MNMSEIVSGAESRIAAHRTGDFRITLRESFCERWTTRVTVTTDEAGTAGFRGFFGAYTLRTVTGNGSSLAGSCAFPRRGARAAEVMVE